VDVAKRISEAPQVSLRTHTREGQTTPPEADEASAAFSSRDQWLMTQLNVDRVYNADQTAVLYEYVPKTTINQAGAKTIWVKSAGKAKERITAMLLGDSQGNKLPAFLVAKSVPSKNSDTAKENRELRHGFGRRVWNQVETFQKSSGVQVYGNTKGWGTHIFPSRLWSSILLTAPT
jgi:hypothetical protein